MDISNVSRLPTIIFLENGASFVVINKYAQDGMIASAEHVNATNLFLIDLPVMIL